MIPNPLHPSLVHFPIVFAVLLPLVAIGALWMIQRGAAARRAWLLPVALAGALTLSAFLAVQTGKAQEERVEDVVGRQPLHSHEESAELFMVLSGILVVVTAVGLAPGLAGRAARIVATLGAFGLLGAGYNVGRSGGELVYRHGAASAYAVQTGPGGPVQPAHPSASDEEGK